jgi:hypothetical protein
MVEHPSVFLLKAKEYILEHPSVLLIQAYEYILEYCG